MALLVAILLPSPAASAAHPQIGFPTANRALLEPGGEPSFFVGTVGKTWHTGMFGCVRTDGRQMHEGIDIKCLKRDARGEPMDPILAVANGVVAYINHKPGLSNYGKYVILRHRIEGLEVYSTYAHLQEVRDGLEAGHAVRAGEVIATMGRTSNTRQRISKERAHLHFEIGLFVNERFSNWYAKALATQRNDHGPWNGQNFLGLDPALILRQQHEQGAGFSLLAFIRAQKPLCRVLVRDTDFPWLKRYTPLVRRNPAADKLGVVAYEIAFNYCGVPFQLIPRAPGEVELNGKYRLLSVDEEEYRLRPCRGLVTKRNGQWELGAAGVRLLDLLTY